MNADDRCLCPVLTAEFERVREAIETVNRVLTLRLEKVDRQLATVKRKNEAPSEQHREQHQRVVSQVQQHQKQLTDIKAKVEILTQAVSTQKDAPAQRPHKDKGEDGKPKLNDRVTYLESQCDGLEVALRECLEDVSNMVNKSDSNTKMMEQNRFMVKTI